MRTPADSNVARDVYSRCRRRADGGADTTAHFNLRRSLAEVPYLAVIAGDSRTRQLAPEVLYERTVVVDVLAQAQKSGEFRFAAEQGQVEQIALARNAEGTVLDIGAAACGRLGTIAPSAVYLTGMGAQDLCTAAMVYRRLLT